MKEGGVFAMFALSNFILLHTRYTLLRMIIIINIDS